MDRKVLLLTPWYFPIRIIRWQDAVKMMYEASVDVVVSYNETISSPSVTWDLPAVIRLHKLNHSRKRGVRFSRFNVYTRDNFICQYCSIKYNWRELSYDHVVPRSSGGRTIWNNIVTACKPCNRRKSDKTCDESGMWPMNKPQIPKALPINTISGLTQEAPPPEWVPFLYP